MDQEIDSSNQIGTNKGIGMVFEIKRGWLQFCRVNRTELNNALKIK